MQREDSSEWVALEGEKSIEDIWRIVADEQGVQICTGDGSELELMPAAEVELRNPRVFPRLQVELQRGELQFDARRPSYEFVLQNCSATILSTPARLRVWLNSETAHMTVEEGAVSCEWMVGSRTETVALIRCQELSVVSGEKPVVAEACDVDAQTMASGSPSPTPQEGRPTGTPTLSPTFTSSPTPVPTQTTTPVRRTPVAPPTPSLTPEPPTETPAPPPPRPKPRPTQPPPTEPPPTQPPPTEPPPTEPPPTQEPPTEPPPTERPTEPPTRPPPTPPPPTP